MIGKDRAKLSRIRAKIVNGKPIGDDESEWLAQHNISPDSLKPSHAPSTSGAPEVVQSTTPGAVPSAPPEIDSGNVWDRVIDTGNDEDDEDEDEDESADESVQTPPATDSPRAAGAPGIVGTAPSTAIVKPSADPMSVEVARSAVSTFFLMNQYAWDIFGDRDLADTEPSPKEIELLTKVVSRYAEKYGWTRELDDALLVGTVLIAYQARAARAPTRAKKKERKNAQSR